MAHIPVRMVPLDLVFEQASGRLLLADNQDARAALCLGYSGHGDNRNNPDAEALRASGPIPRGLWRVGAPRDHSTLGAFAFPLEPVDHKAHGRTAFYIHGDNRKADGSASTGCIIAPRFARECIAALRINMLQVVL